VVLFDLDQDSGINLPNTQGDVLHGLQQCLDERQSCISVELSMDVRPPPETALLAQMPILCFQLGGGAGSCPLLPGAVLFNERKTPGSEASTWYLGHVRPPPRPEEQKSLFTPAGALVLRKTFCVARST